MRQMRTAFRQSIAVQQALQEAKTQSTIIRSTPVESEPVAESPAEPIVEPQPEPIVEEIKSLVEEVKPVEQPKVEQPKTRLPNLGK
jgi:hypothetical protein